MGLKFLTFEFKADEVSDEGLIKGYASTFGNVDQGFDVVEKGAFKKSIKENVAFPILANHNPHEQIGWNEEASEDDKGLKVKGMIDLNVRKGFEMHSLAKKAAKIGAKMGLSIGYMTIKSEPDRDKPIIRRLKELKLFEYSMVTFPMNVEAMVTAAKSFNQLEQAKLLIQQIKDLGIPREELELALRKEAADVEYDPSKIGQSLDRMIQALR